MGDVGDLGDWEMGRTLRVSRFQSPSLPVSQSLLVPQSKSLKA
jgi:hypothetical protein